MLLSVLYGLLLLVSGVKSTEYSSKSCPDQYSRYHKNHTRCIDVEKTPNKKIDWGSMTDLDRELIVETHNLYRGSVSNHNGGQRSSNMLPISYDRELESVAQLWAANCKFDHDTHNQRYIPGKYTVGQNIALGLSDWISVLDLWNSEARHFVYGEGPMRSGDVVGHYTQMVWAETTRVGCGVQNCNGSVPFYVCNYAPGGNRVDILYKPYEVGNSNVECPDYYNNKTNLCECPQTGCYNGGAVDTRSCTCRCPVSSWLQPDNCALQCTRAHDLPMCKHWGRDYCRIYANVKVEYCPIMCRLCPSEDEVNRVSGTGSGSTRIEDKNRPCSERDPPFCGQPNGQQAAGYLTSDQCESGSIGRSCPAMCSKCRAEECRAYSNETYKIGESWTSDYGLHTCTEHGVNVTRGCLNQNRSEVVLIGEKSSIHHEGVDYTCTCTSLSTYKHQLQCLNIDNTELYEDDHVDTDLPKCGRIETARCGLPRDAGQYWMRSHCKLRIVRRVCPALCRKCAAAKCGRYEGSAVDVGAELYTSDGLYVCKTRGWAPGPLITIIDPSSNYTLQRQRVNRVTEAIYGTPKIRTTSVTTPTVVTTTQPATSTTKSTFVPTRATVPPTPVTTTTTAPEKIRKGIQAPSGAEFNVDRVKPGRYTEIVIDDEEGDNSEYSANDEHENEQETTPLLVTDTDGLSPEPDSLTTEDSPGQPETISPVIERIVTTTTTTPTMFITQTIITTTTPTTKPVTYQQPDLYTPYTRLQSINTNVPEGFWDLFFSGKPQTTIPPTAYHQPDLLTPYTRPKSISSDVPEGLRNLFNIENLRTTMRTPVDREDGEVTEFWGNSYEPRADDSIEIIDIGQSVISQANRERAQQLYPDTSKHCPQPDPPYCNQPFIGNSSTHVFDERDCTINPLICPGICGLCTVVQCTDYGNNLYSVGESWHSKYAQMMCTKTGVRHIRGCYYEMLRTFIPAGEKLNQIDGFLQHNCVCTVSLDAGKWDHDLSCNRELKPNIRQPTDNSQSNTENAADPSICEVADDFRCMDPFYTADDCKLLHVNNICPALCGRCKAGFCLDRAGTRYELNSEWISELGKQRCTENGVITIRGCRLIQQSVFVEVNSSYQYTTAGVEYTCTCTKASEYRYQLACEGRRLRTYATRANLPYNPDTTTLASTTTESKRNCRILGDNPRCGQQTDGDWWDQNLCFTNSWKNFMRRACPSLCGYCKARGCRGYSGNNYQLGDEWESNNVIHLCTENGVIYY